MEYQGLTRDDLNNVHALNRAWLEQRAARDAVPSSPQRRERLADTPFLLFSFREAESQLWQKLLGDQPHADLFESPPEPRSRELQVAGLGFLWELGRRNPYVARIVSGAPLDWCDQLAAQTLVRVLECARGANLLAPRFDEDSPLQRRLYVHGGSALREARRSAQLAALQAMLTLSDSARYGRLATAACRMPTLATEVGNKV